MIRRETARGWIRLSGFGRPFGLAVDSYDRLLVADMDFHAIWRLSPALDRVEHLRSRTGWSQPEAIAAGTADTRAHAAPELFNGPHAVALTDNDALVVTTYYDPALFCVSPDAAEIERIPDDAYQKRLRGPASTAICANGQMLVAEYAQNAVLRFDRTGRFVGALGGGRQSFGPESRFSPGADAGAFDRPHMCCIMADGDIVVADTWNHRLQRFDPSGAFKSMLGGGCSGWQSALTQRGPSAEPGAFNGPVAVADDGHGGLLVTDWGNDRLQWFDARGLLLRVDADLGLEKPYDAKRIWGKTVVANSRRGVVMVEDI